MRFKLVFENTNDSIPFDVVSNESLILYFINLCNDQQVNLFSNNRKLASDIEPKITNLHWALSKTNEVLFSLTNSFFTQKTNLEDYLDQKFLNKTHQDWVFSQQGIIEIDKLRFSSDINKSKLGSILHEIYPDDIRNIKLPSVMDKLGYIFPYEEVNLAVHRLESSFHKINLEFSASNKWEVFSNPFFDNFVSNNDIVNFSFGYTYVGRQYYDKFCNFDDELSFGDHYNYENLEFSFNLDLSKPQKINYSEEFVNWAKKHNVRLISNQIPIANIPNLSSDIFEYRKILYRNSQNNNRASIILEEV